MDIYQLELFLAVMNSPSMTRAAEKVYLSPGAVSLQLHNLAEELHTELFVRNGKRLIPTAAAMRLAEHAKTMINLRDHIRQEFENDLTKDTRVFHFATGVTTLIYQLGKPLRQLRKQYPIAAFREESARNPSWLDAAVGAGARSFPALPSAYRVAGLDGSVLPGYRRNPAGGHGGGRYRGD